MEFHFNAELAQKYGVDGAIFLHCIDVYKRQVSTFAVDPTGKISASISSANFLW